MQSSLMAADMFRSFSYTSSNLCAHVVVRRSPVSRTRGACRRIYAFGGEATETEAAMIKAGCFCLLVTYRLVVPVTFLPELRAEQTTTILFDARLAL